MGLVVTSAAATAAALAVHAAVNTRLLRTPPLDPAPVAERVSVLLPLRDEADRVEPCLTALLAQQGLTDKEILVLDDGSTDGTADVVRRIAGGEVGLLSGSAPPPGWLGKPWACAQLAGAATGAVLVFLDADVVLAPAGVAATVRLLRAAGLDLVSPYPRQLAGSLAERLVQPLLQWSWLTLLPLRVAERSPRPALSAANGQLLCVDARAYHAAGGHGSVRNEVVEDVALLRALKRAGGRGGVVDGTAVAVCRMYAGWGELRAGYAKSLWTVPPVGMGLLALVYVLPPLAALARRSRVGALGYAAGVAGRAVAAHRTGGRVWPDALAHPVSVALLCGLAADSRSLHRRRGLTWKGRPLP